MISKVEMDVAENLLKIYGLRNRDRRQQGHCLSAEWRYKADSVVKLDAVTTDWVSYKPEVFVMVDDILHILAEENRESLNVIQIEYGYISRYYKKASASARRKNQRRRHASGNWANKVEEALNDFWLYMQKHEYFDKYFNK
ncbi:hypothetical protein [Snodgrassella alvi]|jgi:hypothetical protein|uniref:Uncharacterized protein n=1 Tax=Snodgrassella alvi TaxID=1196083 RepID=A0A855G2U6_9NEIS|nr:hypothetical protein [Snodgrassella alvi]PIT11645.1 hypothetical protein BGI30_03975 [Snodgrassella alvi]PIT55289.1 hypothetical protein BHC59_11045 [Snodgrassella alvi]PIT62573.1 hypothetical protein BHC57_01175 [Snodgrassella alvi]